jgi:hypothetical protein
MHVFLMESLPAGLAYQRDSDSHIVGSSHGDVYITVWVLMDGAALVVRVHWNKECEEDGAADITRLWKRNSSCDPD